MGLLSGNLSLINVSQFLTVNVTKELSVFGKYLTNRLRTDLSTA